MQKLQTLTHKSIVKLLDYNDNGILDKNGVVQPIQYICLELCQNECLGDIIFSTRPLSEKCARTLFHQVVDALIFIHSKGIYHKNLSSKNILLDFNYNVKIADFGMELNEVKMFNKCIRPPELIEPNLFPINDSANDVFAAGVLLFSITLKRNPFQSASLTDFHYKLIANNKIEEFWALHDIYKKITSELKMLITGMLLYNPAHRLTLSEITSLSWYNQEILTDAQLAQEIGKECSIYENNKLNKTQVYLPGTKGNFNTVYCRSSSDSDIEQVTQYKNHQLFNLTYDPINLRVPTSFISKESASCIFTCIEDYFIGETGLKESVAINKSHFEMIIYINKIDPIEIQFRLYKYKDCVYAKFTLISGNYDEWLQVIDKLFHSWVIQSLI